MVLHFRAPQGIQLSAAITVGALVAFTIGFRVLAYFSLRYLHRP